MSQSTIIQLGETRGGVALQEALHQTADSRFRVASTPLQAAALLAEGPAAVLVLDADDSWACALVETLDQANRPAVLVVGVRSSATIGIADQWLPADSNVATARRHLQRALARAEARRRAPGGGLVDPATGLPNRRALLRALVGKADRARQCRGRLSLVFIRLKSSDLASWRGRPGHDEESVIDAADALKRHLRRNELGGRIERHTFAVVIHGDRKVARAAAVRLERLLTEHGVGVTTSAVEVKLAAPAEALLRHRPRHPVPAMLRSATPFDPGWQVAVASS